MQLRFIIRICIVLASMTVSGCTSLFFRPSSVMIDDPVLQKYAHQDIFFPSADGILLHGWYFPAPDEKGTVIVFHGNVENISTHVKLDLWLIDEGYGLFIFDYRGYGRSGGEPDIHGVHQDANAALEYVLRTVRPGVDRPISVFGKSLGGAIAVYTLAHSPNKTRIHALILDSAFSSYRTIAREKIAESIIGWPVQYPLSFLVDDTYSPLRFIKQIAPLPVMIIHSASDDTVPYHHGQALYDAAGAPKEFRELTIAGHVRAQMDHVTRTRILELLQSPPWDRSRR